nr:transposase [Candidatus Sigynarchaeota archaeon]
MKFVENNELLSWFVRKFINQTRDKSDIVNKTLTALLAGTMLLSLPSVNAIHDELVTGEGKATFYRDVHGMAIGMPTLYNDAFVAMQADSRLAMRNEGVVVIDEHLIEHTGENIEGVACYYSPSEERHVLAISTITLHYWLGTIEYPVAFKIYRRLQELEKCGKAQDYKKKNDIARDMIREVFARKGAPSLALFDSGFMTKKTALLLKALHVNYISRPKRPWTCSYKHKRYSLEKLFETIPVDEFKAVVVTNPKTGKKKTQLAAVRDVYIPQIGKHRVVFVDCTKEKRKKGDKETAETRTAASGRKFRLFITNVMTWDAATILSKYSLRWTIETSYRDMNQHLSLSGCKWRELSAQYFFIALTFLCYLFLKWAKVHGWLTRNSSELRTIGKLKQAFSHYCQYQYHSWLKELEQENGECGINEWILERVRADVC